MTTAKLQIATATHTTEEVSSILSDYTSTQLVSSKQLFGGYSGSSYLVELQEVGSATKNYVVKVSNGYTPDHAEFMCRTAYHLGTVGYKDCCLPIPKRTSGSDGDEKYKFVSSKERDGVPTFLLTCVKGQQADKVMRDHPNLAPTVMRGIGGGLGRMHAASAGIDKEKATALGLRWYERDGGCCDVEDQIDGKVLAKIVDSEARKHPFVPFYERELAALRSEMQLAKEDGDNFALGITHGDPFADNVLVNPTTGELSAFIDIEDVCVGPLLFDLACCAIGCCFKASSSSSDKESKHPQILDIRLLSSLLNGYYSGRKLSDVEREHFVAFMRLTLLCNCCWRFVKFNVDTAEDDDVPDKAKNSYLELQRRIEYLYDDEVVQEIEKLLED